MATRIRVRTLPLAGVAAAGVVFGHWAAYRIGMPQGHLRAHLLAQTGHGYWFLAVKAAVILGLTGAGALFTRDFRAATRGQLSQTGAYSEIVVRLATLQAIAFTVVEMAERAVAGAPLAGTFAHHLFVLGLAVQFLTACVGGVVVLILCRTGSLVGAALSRESLPRPANRVLRPLEVALVPGLFLSRPAGSRAPPRS